MRVSDDVERQGRRFRQIAREAFCRAWQNDRLWALDPDCVCLRDIPGQHASRAEYDFHLAALVASGGMVLAGDRLQDLDEGQGAHLGKLLTLCAARTPAARFDDMGFGRARVALPGGGELLCLFNWDEQATKMALPAGGRDFWNDTPLGETLELAGGQGRVIRYS